jgi:CrcB protein
VAWAINLSPWVVGSTEASKTDQIGDRECKPAEAALNYAEQSNMKAILLVGTGGFLGSVLRYLISGWVFRFFDKPWFPVGTLAVNCLGCLVIGFLGGIAEQKRVFDPEFRLFVFIGILGGFTTFSAFAYETTSLVRDARLAGALINITLQLAGGLWAVWLGALMARFTSS